MSEIVVSRQVFFIGAWRTPNVTDKLQQQICKQMMDKEGYATLLNLTTDGLYLNIKDASGQTTKTDRIPLELVADVIDNKFNNTCILAKVKDTRDNYTVFVFLCRSEEDSKAMVQQFRQLKKRLSGQGYNLDMKQSGLNWTLKNKGPGDGAVPRPNGDSKVTTTIATTTKTNGVPDSVSNASVSSDVREELSDLAREVRDIKLMMQKSRGRQHFAKHYGYLNAPPSPTSPTSQTVVNRQIVTESRVLPQDQEAYQVNVVKRHYVKRDPEPSITLVRSRGSKLKQRQSTSGHFMRASSQSSIASTVKKRVYPSPSPVLNQRYVLPQQLQQQQQQQQQYRTGSLRFVAASQKPALRREYSGGSSSDIIVKNIENVYKSRRMPRRVIQVGPMVPAQSETYDYVQSHARQSVIEDDVGVEQVRSIYQNEPSPDETTTKSVHHVRYVDNSADRMYENTAYHQQGQDVANASTIVNVSSNTLEEDGRLFENENTPNYLDKRPSDVGYRNGNVIMMQGGGDVVRGDANELDDNVIYIKSEHNAHTYSQPEHEQQQVLGGEVYHVRAEGLEQINNENNGYYEAYDDKEMVIIDRDDYDDTQRAGTSSNYTVITAANGGNNGDRGLWGAYAKYPEPNGKDGVIEPETAYRYKDDEDDDDDDDVPAPNGDHDDVPAPNGDHGDVPAPNGDHDDVPAPNGDHGDVSKEGTAVNDQEHEEGVAKASVTAVHSPVEKRVRYLDEQLEQTIEDRNTYRDDAEQRVDDVIEDNDNEVRNMLDKGKDEVNNNLDNLNDPLLRNRDIIDDGVDLQASKGSVVNELQQKFANESESNVLF